MSIIKIPSTGTSSAIDYFNQIGATSGRILFSNSDNLDHLSVIDKDGNIIDLETSSIDELNDIGDVTITGVSQGDIIYRSATNWVNLNPGTVGQVLTTNGNGTNPSWENVPSANDGNGIFDIDITYLVYTKVLTPQSLSFHPKHQVNINFTLVQ